MGLIGGSMGNVTAANYAKRNLGNVAAMVGFIPASSLAYHYSSGDDATGGFQPEIDSAYGGDYTAGDNLTAAQILDVLEDGDWT